MYYRISFILLLYVILCNGTVVELAVNAIFRKVVGTIDQNDGEIAMHTQLSHSKLMCVIHCLYVSCYKVSWDQSNRTCAFYYNPGPVSDASPVAVFYKKDIGNSYTFSKEQNMWYRFHHVSLPPQNAVSACANDNGGRLMYIDSSSRQQFIEQALAEVNGFFIFDGFDYDNDDTWQHTDGTVMTYFNFYSPDEPTNYGGDNCLAIHTASSFQWHDVNCVFPRNGFICEIIV